MRRFKLIRVLQDVDASPADDAGAAAVEYAIIVVFIAAIIVTVVFVLGQQTYELFNCTYQTLRDSVTTCH